jgi:hypothetical protein
MPVPLALNLIIPRGRAAHKHDGMFMAAVLISLELDRAGFRRHRFGGLGKEFRRALPQLDRSKTT